MLLLGPPGQFPGVGDGSALYTVIGDLNRNGQLQNNVSGAAPDDRGVIFRVQQDGSAGAGQSLHVLLQRDDDANLCHHRKLPWRRRPVRRRSGATTRTACGTASASDSIP